MAQRLLGGQREVARARVAVLRPFGHAAGDHRIEGLGDVRAPLTGRGYGVHHVGGDQHAGAVGPVGRRPGQALEQHARQRVDVGAVGDLGVGKPFGRHVFPGADRGAQLGEFLVGGGAGDAEVDEVGEVVGGDQDVLRFDVAVHDAGGVRGIERGGDLGDDGDRAWRGQRPEAFQHAVQVGALDQAHLQKDLAVDFAVVVHGHHMGFLQTSGGAGLAFHPLAEDGVSAEAFGEKFDRHGPLFDGVFGLVDLTHPTAAQQPFQVVGAEHRPRP